MLRMKPTVIPMGEEDVGDVRRAQIPQATGDGEVRYLVAPNPETPSESKAERLGLKFNNAFREFTSQLLINLIEQPCN